MSDEAKPDPAAPAAPAGAPDIAALIKTAVEQAVGEALKRLPKPDTARPAASSAASQVAPADALAALVREKWGLDDADDVAGLIDELAPHAAKARSKSMTPTERRQAQRMAEMERQLAEQTKAAKQREFDDRRKTAYAMAREVVGKQRVINAGHVLAAASQDGLLAIDPDTGELMVAVEGRDQIATPETLSRFFEGYLRGNPHLVQPPAAGGPRVAPGTQPPPTPPSLKDVLAPQKLATVGGRRAAVETFLRNPDLLTEGVN